MKIFILSSLPLLFGFAVAQDLAQDAGTQACIIETEAMFDALPDLTQAEQEYLRKFQQDP